MPRHQHRWSSKKERRQEVYPVSGIGADCQKYGFRLGGVHFFEIFQESKLESQKGGSGEGSWEAFWGRKTVPKWDFEACMMGLEKETNFDAKIGVPGPFETPRES